MIRGGYALVWIEQAGITTPFTHSPVSLPAERHAAVARFHPSRVRPLPGSYGVAASADRGRRAGPGRVHRDSRSGLGLRAAMERSVPARVRCQPRARGRLRRIQGNPHRDPGHQHQPASRWTSWRKASPCCSRVPNPCFGEVPRLPRSEARPSHGLRCCDLSSGSRPSASTATTWATRTITRSKRSSKSGSETASRFS